MLTMRFLMYEDIRNSSDCDPHNPRFVVWFDIIDEKGSFITYTLGERVKSTAEGKRWISDILNGKRKEFDPKKYHFKRLYTSIIGDRVEIHWIGDAVGKR